MASVSPGRARPACLVRLRGLVPAVLVAALAAGMSGCMGDGSTPAAGSPPAQGRPAAEPVSQAGRAVPGVWTTVQVGEVTGPWPLPARKVVRDRIRGVFDRWADAAYLGGSYPRRRFGAAFPGFTRGARAEARRDLGLTTNADIADRIDLVRHRASAVWLDVLAVRGRAAALTARFRLAFNTRGQVERWVVVRGRLYLTKKNNRWRIFGYDVAKGQL